MSSASYKKRKAAAVKAQQSKDKGAGKPGQKSSNAKAAQHLNAASQEEMRRTARERKNKEARAKAAARKTGGSKEIARSSSGSNHRNPDGSYTSRSGHASSAQATQAMHRVAQASSV